MAEYTKIETAMEIICCLCNDLYPNSVCPGECNWMGYLRENAADVAPVVHGRWEIGNPFCPVCGKDKFAGLDADIWCDWLPDYCPNCGASMDACAE